MYKIGVLQNKKLEFVELDDSENWFSYVDPHSMHYFDVTCLHDKEISWIGGECDPIHLEAKDINAIIWDSRLKPNGHRKVCEWVTGISVFVSIGIIGTKDQGLTDEQINYIKTNLYFVEGECKEISHYKIVNEYQEPKQREGWRYLPYDDIWIPC